MVDGHDHVDDNKYLTIIFPCIGRYLRLGHLGQARALVRLVVVLAAREVDQRLKQGANKVHDHLATIAGTLLPMAAEKIVDAVKEMHIATVTSKTTTLASFHSPPATTNLPAHVRNLHRVHRLGQVQNILHVAGEQHHAGVVRAHVLVGARHVTDQLLHLARSVRQRALAKVALDRLGGEEHHLGQVAHLVAEALADIVEQLVPNGDRVPTIDIQLWLVRREGTTVLADGQQVCRQLVHHDAILFAAQVRCLQHPLQVDLLEGHARLGQQEERGEGKPHKMCRRLHCARC